MPEVQLEKPPSSHTFLSQFIYPGRGCSEHADFLHYPALLSLYIQKCNIRNEVAEQNCFVAATTFFFFFGDFKSFKDWSKCLKQQVSTETQILFPGHDVHLEYCINR